MIPTALAYWGLGELATEKGEIIKHLSKTTNENN